MRKYLIGILIGVALTITSSVFADDIISLIGQKIQGEFPVKINGKTLEKPAIVIDGTSYLPNRTIAEALGMDITFDADLGIELKSKEVSPDMTSQTEPIIETIYSEKEIELKIRAFENLVKMYNYNIQSSPESSQMDSWKVTLKQYQDELAVWEARKAALTQ